MDFNKILGIVAVILALVAAFVTIPYATPILGILGLILGFSIAGEDHVRVIVSALALTYLGNTFEEIPQAGMYLSSILTNIGAAAAGAALMIVLRNIYARYKP